MWNFLIPAATAVMGARQAQAQQDAQDRNNKMQAELTKTSWVTDQPGQIDTSARPSAFAGALSGGLQGLGMTQNLGLWGDVAKKEDDAKKLLTMNDAKYAPQKGNGGIYEMLKNYTA